MKRWVLETDEFASCLKDAGAFLVHGMRLPERVELDDVRAVGFCDEIRMRQSIESLQCLRKFLNSVGESSFYFHWLGSAPDEYKNEFGVFPIFYCEINSMEDQFDLVTIQRTEPIQEATYFDRWMMTSHSRTWAIYGEQYGGEICIFLSRNEDVCSSLRHAFSFMVTDPSEAVRTMTDPEDPESSAQFIAAFDKNYRS